jgi:hypothetical protein
VKAIRSSRDKQDSACRRRFRLARRGTRQRSSEGPASRRACDARLVDAGPVWLRSASDHHLLRLKTNRLFCPGSRTMQRKLLSRGQWLRPSFLLIENVASAQPRRTWISTLVPERLRPTDLLDLSGMKKASCAVDGLTQPPSSLLYTSSRDAQKWSTRIAFPSNTRGFLYCHVPDPVHPAAAEVRFRLTPEVADDPQTAFELGEDLLLSPETPWRIHVISIARSRGTYEALATLLLRDGLASQEAMTHWAQAKTRLERRTQVLCRLGQPFVYRLDSQELWLYVADGLDIRKIPLKGLLRDSRGAKTAGLPSTYPYSGTHCSPLRWH